MQFPRVLSRSNRTEQTFGYAARRAECSSRFNREQATGLSIYGFPERARVTVKVINRSFYKISGEILCRARDIENNDVSPRVASRAVGTRVRSLLDSTQLPGVAHGELIDFVARAFFSRHPVPFSRKYVFPRARERRKLRARVPFACVGGTISLRVPTTLAHLGLHR